ncbi:glycosyltransferase [Microlunatus antarcticus]|uniref:Glycosyltransferase like family protein n=1 Tax=Microlunatus antarcticus TaxID=53388 RepID=A0A7W5JUL6_9ACTN|nr:glycosyltransferase [Microlunatus antarcticus]MBB3326102.1 hypothetical protein [Microlunatus antarcticus]
MTTDRDPDGGISIACVFNDPAVRRECLDRSVEAYAGPLDVDYIPVDNTEHAFSSAGAALNHAARQARHSVVVFVHQDVYLHSVERLAEAARAFDGGDWGVLGANGVTSDGRSVGLMRDRTQLIGMSAPRPVPVQTLDEVLFMIPRDLVLEHPLTEAPDLAWHAYGVEYSLRMASLGRRAGAVDLAITHNSLTVNMARLDEAHHAVGRLHPAQLPIQTTCGVIGGHESRLRARPLVRRHGWRLRWLRHSWLALRARRRLGVPVVLSDMREEVDLLPLHADVPLRLVNIDHGGAFADHNVTPLLFSRHGRPVLMSALPTADAVPGLIAALAADEILLVGGLTLDDLTSLSTVVPGGRSCLLGLHSEEIWLLCGVPLDRLPESWSRPAAVPLGARG